MRDGESAVYRFRAGGAPLVLRVTDERHRDRGQIEAELEFIRFLASRGIPAAEPVPSAAGAWVETVPGGGRAAHAVAFEEKPGRHFEYHSSDIGPPLFHLWGRTMGALHAASRDFRPTPPHRRRSWHEDEVAGCRTEGVPPSEMAALREHERVRAWLATLPAPPDRVGLIHGDFERTNFLLDGARLHLFDFDDACYHWLLADVAHALWAFRGASADERRRFLAWFVEGYRERAPLPAETLAEFSWFVRMRSLALFLRHARTGRAADPAAPLAT